MEAIEKVGASTPELEAFVHGTTVALNALLEGKTPTVGLITTRGFRDVLEIMRTNRPTCTTCSSRSRRRWSHAAGGSSSAGA